MPEEREPINLFDSSCQYEEAKKYTIIEKQLIDNICKKGSNQLDLKNAALRTIDNYPYNIVHIYTDGLANSGIYKECRIGSPYTFLRQNMQRNLRPMRNLLYIL